MTQSRAINNTSVVAVGAGCGVANGVDTTATGTCAQAGTMVGVNGATSTIVANGATAYGSQSLAQDSNTTAIGFRSTAKQEGSVAIGYQAQALADPSTAVGANSYVAANADNGVAIGANASVTGANGTALGFGSSAMGANSVALGAGSIATQPNTVSVGSPGNERRITNVAAGIAPTDAANVSQLQNSQQQMNAQLGAVSKVAYSGTALALAMSGTYMPSLSAGEKAVGLGIGTYHGYTGFALNFKQMADDGQMTWGAGVSTTGKEWGLNAGIGWKWK
ncbi:YadA family autotransporter adhesin [Variovorax sp. PAMC28562]|uniref:YadA family autotransporter adhesin n=1 Tax=Variovorax sp. PAMC28562 TaxID=2762323 RepID=UPI0021C2A022|nr:YadA-like family protein [Variovorax sp. PAMC28562]